MADSKPEEFLNSISETEKWKNNRIRLYDEYPAHTFPVSLKPSTGKKATLCLFEQIDADLYDKSAKMVAFKTNAERLPAWIRAAWLFFYDHLGELDTYNINWTHDPPLWSKDSDTQLKSININVSASGEAEAELDNPLLYRITIFISTGLIEVQGNGYNDFRTNVFPILIQCVNKMTEGTSFLHESDTSLKTIDDSSSGDKVSDANFEDIPKSDINPMSDTTNLEDNPKPDTTNLGSEIFQQFENNISEALMKLKLSQEQFLNNKVAAAMLSHSAILENHGKLIESLSSKISNLQANPSTPNKTGHDHANKKLELEVLKLNQKIRSLEAEKSDHDHNIQKLKSDYEMKISILESEKDFLQQSLTRTKRQLSSALNDNSQEEKLLYDKIEKKNNEILQLEETIASLRRKTLKAEVLLSNTVTSPIINSFEPVSTKYTDKVKVLISEETAGTPKQPAQINSPTKDMNKDKSVLLIGTSIVRNIDPKLLSREYDVTKSPAYSLEETSKVVEASKCEPDVVVFHSMTNNLKSEDPTTCVKKLNDIVDITTNKWPSAQIMVSMETPRDDGDDLNDKVLVVNGLIRSTFYKKDNLSIIDNSNMAVQGQPIPRFLNANDKVHLSRQGTSMLASNIRLSLDAHFGLRGAGKGIKLPPPEVGSLGH